MSTTTTTTAQAAAANVQATNNPQPDAFTTSAFDYIAGMRPTLEKAQRQEQAIYQTVVALFLELARRSSILPTVSFKRGKTEETIAGEEITLIALTGVDGDATERKNRGTTKLYDALSALMARALGIEMDKTAKDIVLLAGRMARYGYTVADWNGSIREVEGKMVPHIAEPTDKTEPADYPGVFRLHPYHIGGHEDAKLVVAGKRPKPGSTDGEMEDVFVNAERQAIPLYDHWVNIVVGKDAPQRKRIGRQSFMDGTKAYGLQQHGKAIAAKEEADRLASEAEKQKQREATAEHQANASPDANPEDVASRKDSNEQPPPGGNNTSTGTTGNASTATGDAAKGGDAKNGTTNASPTANGDASTGNTNAAGEHDRRVNEDQTRADREKLNKAMTPAELPDWIAQTFKVARIKEDPALRLPMLQTYSHLFGILTALGMTEFAKAPSPTTMRAAKEMSLTKPAAAKPATAKK